MAEPRSPDAVRNPYPGLRPFNTDEEHLFFGRERQVDRMVDKLAARRFLAVVGTSGSGKSSLVNCGLRPALHRGHMARAGSAWRMATLRPGSAPLAALAQALALPGVLYDAAALAEMARGPMPAAKLIGLTLQLGSQGLVDIVEQARLPAGTQLLLVADQFEELFRYVQSDGPGRPASDGPSEEAVAFVQLLLAAAEQTEVPIHVVLTMRSDFLGDCAQFRGLPEAINDSQYLVPRLTRDEIRAAIAGPAGVRGVAISPVLMTRLLNDVGDKPDQLSLLQHALNRTWFESGNDVGSGAELALDHYVAAGGIDNALNLHADKAYRELPDEPSRQLCTRVFKALTDTGTDARGTRRPMSLQRLSEVTGADLEPLRTVLDVFRKPSRSFVMPPLREALRPDSVIDISHECLMRVWQRLARWTQEEARSARIYRRLRDTALEHAADKAGLWRNPDLGVALQWHEQTAPTAAWAMLYGGQFDAASDFLARSHAAQQAEDRAAEIERRWAGRWSLLPLALVFVPYIYLQPMAKASIDAWIGKILALWTARAGVESTWWTELTFVLANALEATTNLWSHVGPGLAALLLYLVLAPLIKQRFPAWSDGLALLRQRVVQGLQPLRRLLPLLFPAASADERRARARDVSTHGHGGFFPRLLAASVDGFLAGLFAGLLMAASWSWVQDSSSAWVLLPLMIFYLSAIWYYHCQGWTSRHQATWGMRLAGLVVTDLQGLPLDWRQASKRFFARWLSTVLVYLGFLMQPFTARRQTLHDLMAHTVVIHREPIVAAALMPDPRLDEPANLRQRLHAQFVDMLVAVALLWAWLFVVALIGLDEGLAGVPGFILLVWLYRAATCASVHRATWGMRLAGIVVADEQGHRLGWHRSLGRAVARCLSYASFGFGFLMCAWTARRQTLHDKLARTRVLRRGGRLAAGAPPAA